MSVRSSTETVITADSARNAFDLSELLEYRDLVGFMVWRNIKIRYAQSALGIGWAVLQPVCSMIVFTVIFGRLVGVDSGDSPYALFAFAALVPWTYFSNVLTQGTASLVVAADMISKVYFPRLVLPVSVVLARLVDFFIALLVLAGMMCWYRVLPGSDIIFLPLLVALMVATAAGLSIWLTALAIQYRDVNYAVTFLSQLLIYAVPVVYPVTLIPERFQFIYALNPMVGVIEGFRSALLGTTNMPWHFIALGSASSIVILFAGTVFFRTRERVFADVA